HILYSFQHSVRADRAIQPNDISASFIEPPGEKLRGGSIAGIAVVLDCHLGNDGKLAHRPDRFERLVDLGYIREGFKNQEVPSAFEKSFSVLGEDCSSLFDRGRAVGFDAYPERADGAGDKRSITGGFAGESCSAGVYVANFVLQSVCGQLRPIRSIG